MENEKELESSVIGYSRKGIETKLTGSEKITGRISIDYVARAANRRINPPVPPNPDEPEPNRKIV
jgi:hypothetical protein